MSVVRHCSLAVELVDAVLAQGKEPFEDWTYLEDLLIPMRLSDAFQAAQQLADQGVLELLPRTGAVMLSLNETAALLAQGLDRD